MDWEQASFVLRAKNRLSVLRALVRRPMTPSFLSKELEISISHISRTLRELETASLVRCMTGARKGRIYNPTKLGRELIIEMVRERLIEDG